MAYDTTIHHARTLHQCTREEESVHVDLYVTKGTYPYCLQNTQVVFLFNLESNSWCETLQPRIPENRPHSVGWCIWCENTERRPKIVRNIEYQRMFK